MDNINDCINIEVHIPKSGIFLLGSCIQYIFKICNPSHTLSSMEDELLSGSIDLGVLLTTFESLQEDYEQLDKLLEKVSSENEDLSFDNERLIDMVDEYRANEISYPHEDDD